MSFENIDLESERTALTTILDSEGEPTPDVPGLPTEAPMTTTIPPSPSSRSSVSRTSTSTRSRLQSVFVRKFLVDHLIFLWSIVCFCVIFVERSIKCWCIVFACSGTKQTLSQNPIQTDVQTNDVDMTPRLF